MMSLGVVIIVTNTITTTTHMITIRVVVRVTEGAQVVLYGSVSTNVRRSGPG